MHLRLSPRVSYTRRSGCPLIHSTWPYIARSIGPSHEDALGVSRSILYRLLAGWPERTASLPRNIGEFPVI